MKKCDRSWWCSFSFYVFLGDWCVLILTQLWVRIASSTRRLLSSTIGYVPRDSACHSRNQSKRINWLNSTGELNFLRLGYLFLHLTVLCCLPVALLQSITSLHSVVWVVRRGGCIHEGWRDRWVSSFSVSSSHSCLSPPPLYSCSRTVWITDAPCRMVIRRRGHFLLEESMLTLNPMNDAMNPSSLRTASHGDKTTRAWRWGAILRWIPHAIK